MTVSTIVHPNVLYQTIDAVLLKYSAKSSIAQKERLVTSANR